MRPAESLTLPDDLRQVKTMLSAQELTLLYRLARDSYDGGGEIVDGGAFLGGSTLALALGLRDNPRVADKAFRIHSYDYFVADHFVAQFISGVPEGASTRPYYDRVIAPVASHVTVHEGDLTTFPWPAERPVDILFIDVAKSWETNDFLLHQFFPRLTAGSYSRPAGLSLAAHTVDLDHDGAAQGLVHAPRVDAVGDGVLPVRSADRSRPAAHDPPRSGRAASPPPGRSGAGLRTRRP